MLYWILFFQSYYKIILIKVYIFYIHILFEIFITFLLFMGHIGDYIINDLWSTQVYKQ